MVEKPKRDRTTITSLQQEIERLRQQLAQQEAENARLFKEWQDRVSELAALNRIAQATSSTMRLEGLFEALEVAQTVVHLGVDLSGLVTMSDLKSGVQFALARLNRRIVEG